MTVTQQPQRNMAGRSLSGRYTLLSLIAQGGMGEVWKARDRVTGNLVAAKVLRPELTGEEISLSRLRLEAQNAMRARHPNIAAVLDSGEDHHQGWIVMELVDGSPLTRYVGDGARLTEAELIRILVQTAYALDAAARAGVVHRDIKPANIIVRPDGKVKLTDFGVSFSDGQANLTAAGMVMGTAQYLPPEQAMGKPATPVGDLYALGVIAFEALAGYRPYTGKTQVDVAFAHVNEAIPQLPVDASETLAALIYRLLAKEPEERPQTGAALARELAQVAAGLGIDTEPQRVVGIGRPGKTPTDPATAKPPTPPVHHVTKRHLPADGAAAAVRHGRWHPVRGEEAQAAAQRLSLKTHRTPVALKTEPKDQRSEGSKVGLSVIVSLVALTLILIAIAMVRGSGEPSPSSSPTVSSFSAATSGSYQIQEVDPWSVPILAA